MWQAISMQTSTVSPFCLTILAKDDSYLLVALKRALFTSIDVFRWAFNFSLVLTHSSHVYDGDLIVYAYRPSTGCTTGYSV